MSRSRIAVITIALNPQARSEGEVPMSRPRIAVITVASMLPVLLALGIWGTVTSRNYKLDANGKVVYEETVAYGCDCPDRSEAVLFTECAGPVCHGIQCGFCHTGGEDRRKDAFTSDKHLQGYYPRFRLSLSEGQKLSWGRSGGYLTSRSGKVEYYLKDGTLDMIAPPGSLILKDRTGRPFLLYMPGDPTLQPKRP